MIVPFKLSEHLIHYFFRELKGQSRKYAGREVKVIHIDKHSFIGKIIIPKLEKIDYPVRNIKEFNLFIEMINVKRDVFCSKQKLFKKETLENSFVEVSEDCMKEINTMLDDIFRQNFFFYVYGSVMNDEKKVIPTIRQFMDQYDLWKIAFFDIGTMSRMYYRMKKEGPGTWLQNRDLSHTRIDRR